MHNMPQDIAKTKVAPPPPGIINSSTKPGDFHYLIDHLNDYSPGSNRTARSRGGYVITRQDSGHESILKSKIAAVPPHDQELKMYSKLKSGEFDLDGVNTYRKGLVKQTANLLFDTPVTVQAKAEAVDSNKTKGAQSKLKIGNSYRQHSQLDLVMAELAYSPLNGDNELPSNHIEMTGAIRDLRFSQSAPALRQDGEHEPPESPLQIGEDTETSTVEAGSSMQRSKYSITEEMASPFLLPTGKPVTSRKLKDKKKRPGQSSRLVDKPKRAPAVRKKVKSPDTFLARVPTQWNGESDTGDISAKLPSRLREKVSQKFTDIVTYKHKSSSEATWKAIKRKHQKEKMLRLEHDCRQRASAGGWQDSSGHESPGMGFPDESIIVTPSADGSAVQSMMAFDMQGLMTLDELEELSVGSNGSNDYVRDGSAAGLFGTESLANLHISPADQTLLEDADSPEDVLAGCLGKLLFADDGRAVRVRPASAGIGGVCVGKILTSPSASPGAPRPHSAHPNGVKAKLFDTNPVSPPYKTTAKRAVVTRNRPTCDWIS